MVGQMCWHGCVGYINYAVIVFLFVSEGWTPLMLACKKGHVHIVNMLINNDAHINLQNEVCNCKVIVNQD